MAESSLPLARITGEVGRTTGQLRMFAGVVRQGDHLGVRIDPALPDRAPLPRSDIRQRMVPLGPVAVFGASNFPLAFSTAGGDTASALAAGCPVVVKGHPAHPRAGVLVARRDRPRRRVAGAARRARSPSCSPSTAGAGSSSARRSCRTRAIKAVGFTGSRAGGLALVATAVEARRAHPRLRRDVVDQPGRRPPRRARRGRHDALAQAYVGSLTLGAGQFCTNPGLLFLPVRRGR